MDAMDVVGEKGTENAEIIQLISTYVDSGKGEDFYAIQQWMANRDSSSGPLEREIVIMLEKIKNSSQNKNKKEAAATQLQQGKIETGKLIDIDTGDQTGIVAEMFADEIEGLRTDSEFVGTQMQMEYLRDILNCGVKLNIPMEP
jgi:hypothetical protein